MVGHIFGPPQFCCKAAHTHPAYKDKRHEDKQVCPKMAPICHCYSIYTSTNPNIYIITKKMLYVHYISILKEKYCSHKYLNSCINWIINYLYLFPFMLELPRGLGLLMKVIMGSLMEKYLRGALNWIPSLPYRIPTFQRRHSQSKKKNPTQTFHTWPQEKSSERPRESRQRMKSQTLSPSLEFLG